MLTSFLQTPTPSRHTFPAGRHLSNPLCPLDKLTTALVQCTEGLNPPFYRQPLLYGQHPLSLFQTPTFHIFFDDIAPNEILNKNFSFFDWDSLQARLSSHY